MKRFQKSFVAVLMCGTLLSTTGCQMTKQELGTGIGAVLGVAAGSVFGKGAGKYVAMAVGAAAGAYIGNYIGAQLDEADRAAVERNAVAALEGSKDGQAVSWENPDSKVSATLTPVSTQTVTKNMKIARSKSIQAPGAMEIIGQPYEVKGSSLNVRSGPSTSQTVVSSLKRNQIVTAVGRVEGSEWILVAKEGRSFGYVHGDYMKPATEVNVAKAIQENKAIVAKAQTAPEGSQQQSEIQAAAIDLDALEPKLRESAAIDLDDMFAEQDDIIVEEIAMTTECREIQADITTTQEKSSDKFQACKAPDGAWELG